jgi:multidrug transporter EmrE-like cation transporter
MPQSPGQEGVRLFAVLVGIISPWRAACGVEPGIFLQEERKMSTVKVVALALIAAGVLGLAYGSFSYTKETQEVKLGPLELSMKEKQTVNIPVWAGVGAIVVGGALLFLANKQS